MSNRKHRVSQRLGKILLAAHRVRYGGIWTRGWPHPVSRADIRRLKRMGLLKTIRAPTSGWSTTGRPNRNHLVLTPSGEEAAWRGELPRAKPKAKSERTEKRGRHVRRGR
jgi:hypothetical protein